MSKNLPAEQKANLYLQKATIIIAKIAEVLHWCLAGVMLIGAAVAIIHPAPFVEWVKAAVSKGSNLLSCYSFEVMIADQNHTPQFGSIAIFALGSAVILSLMAMIFRNIYLILKTSVGKTWFAKGDTPFQKSIVRMLREIGIFFILIAVIGSTSSIVVSALGGETNGINYMNAFVGLVFICISQFFNYGANLEKDLDGLV